jgi:two-component system NtrC family response regulator
VHEVVRVLTRVASLALELATREGDTPPVEIPDFIAVAPAMRRVRKELFRLAASRAPMLIEGAPGTGKELVARAIHDLSPRGGGPFVTFDDGSDPRELLECARAAASGTFFIDDIAELPLELQSKLLVFLEEEDERARVVAATHDDLAQHVREGRFREDLFHRLGGVALVLPPLRERSEDIVPLARHFIRALTPPNRELPALAPEAIARLATHPWPGNVRDLRLVIERCLAVASPPRLITESHLRFGA